MRDAKDSSPNNDRRGQAVSALLTSGWWPVAANYVVVAGLDGRRWLEPLGDHFAGHRHPGSVADVRELRKGSEADLVAWARVHGMPGGRLVEGTLADGSYGGSEAVDEIRQLAMTFAGGEAAITALRRGSGDRHLRRLATILRGGPPRPASSIATEAGLLPRSPDPGPLPRRSLGPDLQLLDAVGFAIRSALEGSGRVGSTVRATRYTVQLTPTIEASGPFALAFVRLLREIAGVRFTRGARGPRLTWRQVWRECRGCGLEFIPDKPNQYFHDRPCQWRFNQREKRNRDRERQAVQEAKS
jgi:hypothetical protein